MINKNIFLAFSLFFIYSCGGGGAAPFAFTVGLDKVLSTNEDVDLSGKFATSTNYTSNITYLISSLPVNGNANINSSGTFTYSPYSNYFGEDNFEITLSATQIDENQQPVGTPITYTRKVDVTVNPVNDSPTITITSDFSNYDNNTMVFDSILKVNARISDVDNDVSELVVYGDIANEIISGSFTEPVISAAGEINLNMSDLNKAGYQELAFCVSDGSLAQCADGFSAYFISNKYTIDIENNCDSDGINCSSDSHYVYYLVGSPNDTAQTEYVFIGDRITSENYEFFRSEVLDSVNTLVSSDASPFIEDFFSIAVIEEVAKTGLSAFEIEAGCYPSTPTVYCIGDVSRDKIRNAFDYDVAAFISSLSGRGVAQGDINIQQLSNGTEEVVMHELGHSHGYMGDEYDSGGEYDDYVPRADTYINTTSVSNPNNVKWKHFIDDLNNVPGVDYDICYNYSDGDIYYRDQVGNGTYQDCECFYNQYSDNETFTGENVDPDCMNKTGVIPGTYYSEDETYRPLYWTVMESGADQGYGKVNIEGFAYGSIMNQGFGNYSINGASNYEGLTSSSALSNGRIEFVVDAVYDPTKVKLKWFVDDIEQPQLENNVSVSFDRPASDAVVTYAWVVEDLTLNVVAPNDITNPVDFYEGWFESNYYYESNDDNLPYDAQQPYVGSWLWYSSNDGYLKDNEISSNQDFMFAEICCSMGAAIKINWSKYDESSDDTSNSRGKFDSFKRITPSANKDEKVFTLDLSEDYIQVNSIELEKPNKKDIIRPIIKKNDIYVVNFFNNDNELIYKLGIGNPFEIKIQHIGYADKLDNGKIDHEHYLIRDDKVSDFKLVIPSQLDPHYISLSKKQRFDRYIEVQRINLK
jgi:hypothetical protein